MNSLKMPAFANEAEEAAWWFENREEHDRRFEQAVDEGLVQRGSVVKRMAAMRALAAAGIHPDDVRLAAELAERRGLEVTTYLANLLHTTLEKELRDAA